MLARCQALVVRVIEHTDRTSILKCYTDKFGLRSYMIRRTKRTQQALLQPLSLLELTVQERHDRELQQLREMSLIRRSPAAERNILSTTLAVFAQEFLVHALHEESGDEDLFETLNLYAIAIATEPTRWSAHQLIVSIGTHMGILPPPPDAPFEWYDVAEGLYASTQPIHGHCFGRPWAQILPALQADGRFAQALDCSAEDRRQMLTKLLQIFRYHTGQAFQLRSPQILQEVLS